MPRQRTLSEDVQLFIVGELAMFRSPSQVAESVKEEFGIQITRQLAESYNPERRAGSSVSEKLREVFYATRRRFLRRLTDRPMYHQAYRLAELHRQYLRADAAGNTVEARAALEQAAKEVGGLYTNRRVFEVSSLNAAREAFRIMLDEFRPQIEQGSVTTEQLAEIVAEDHGVDADDLLPLVSELEN